MKVLLRHRPEPVCSGRHLVLYVEQQWSEADPRDKVPMLASWDCKTPLGEKLAELMAALASPEILASPCPFVD